MFDKYQLMIWYGRMLKNPFVPFEQKEIARKEISENILNFNDRNHQMMGLSGILEFIGDASCTEQMAPEFHTTEENLPDFGIITTTKT